MEVARWILLIAQQNLVRASPINFEFKLNQSIPRLLSEKTMQSQTDP
jgi:hypothetical protein